MRTQPTGSHVEPKVWAYTINKEKGEEEGGREKEKKGKIIFFKTVITLAITLSC